MMNHSHHMTMNLTAVNPTMMGMSNHTNMSSHNMGHNNMSHGGAGSHNTGSPHSMNMMMQVGMISPCQ